MPVAALSKAYRNEKSSMTGGWVCMMYSHNIVSLWMFSHAQIISQDMGISSMKSHLRCATFPDFDHITPTVNSKA
jgi:hypothetical protein